MSNLSIDISGKIDKCHIEVIKAIKSSADALKIPFFIIGASARDYIFQHFYGVSALRKTNDIDVGISISTWNEFEKLKKLLIDEKGFTETNIKQRLRKKHDLVDIVPYGNIAGSDYRLSWPPENEIVMNTLGFQEAYQNSLIVKIENNLKIRISSLPGLVALKLISWEENYPDRKRDAEDIRFIMQNYENAGNFERLYDQEKDILEEESFDNTLASIRLLGKDIAKILNDTTKEKVTRILVGETSDESEYKLVLDMMEHRDDFENTLLQLKKMAIGFSEGK